MLSVECNGGSWPAGAKDDSGLLWFPTQKGSRRCRPDVGGTTVAKPPRVEIESASIEHKPQAERDHVVLRPGQTNLEMEYTALSYTRPEQISFRYKLDGIDEDMAGRRPTAHGVLLASASRRLRLSRLCP